MVFGASQSLWQMLRSIAGLVSPSRFPTAPGRDKNSTMKAIVMRTHGNLDVLVYEDFPSPLPAKKSHVVIDIVAAGCNPVDFKMRKNPIADWVYPKPKILGSDMAGIVHSVQSEIGTGKFQIGDRVFGMLPLLGSCYGGYAERCCVDENILAKAPDNVLLVDLAVMPLVACTVVQAFRPVIAAFKGKENMKGLKCFIQAGSGGVGCLAVQYCANVLGMTVATTCSPRNFELMLSLGASQCIDYHTEKVEDVLQDCDVFLDTLGYQFEKLALGKSSKLMRKSGPHCSHYIRIASSPHESNGTFNMSGDPLGLSIPEARLDRVASGFSKQFLSKMNVFSRVKYHFVFVKPEAAAIEEIGAAMSAGLIRAVTQEAIPLSDARRAHDLLESGHVTGKIALIVNEPVVSGERSKFSVSNP